MDFYYLSAWCGCWSVVYIDRCIFTFLSVCPFDYTAVVGNETVGPVNLFNHTSWLAVVTPTDHRKSVRNRRVIQRFEGVYVLSLCLVLTFMFL